jgi:flagellar biosynthesis/type III secretory pathway chaperone
MAFQTLIQTMTALNGIHDTLSELAEEKKQVLIHNQVERLTQIVSRENKLIKQISDLDQQRKEAMGQFLMDRGYKPNPKVTVSDLTKIIFNMEEKTALINLQKQLLATIRRLRDMNQLNQQLIEHSLSFIDYSLDIIVGPPEDDVFYHKPQQSNQGNKRLGIFDTRA